MKLPLLIPLILACVPITSRAAIVLTNLGEPVITNNLIKATGGFIPTAIEIGFEFTVGGGDYQLTTLTLTIGTHQGSQPLVVELYGSPAGPNTATLITQMTGPAQPSNQDASYTPATPAFLTDGETYFVRLAVPGSASSYTIPKTASPATGAFTLGNSYQRNAGNAWAAGNSSTEPILEISATPVPEPSILAFGSAALLLLLRRRLS